MRISQTDTRCAARVLARARELAGPAHRIAVDSLPAGIRQIAGYHAGWWDADGRASAVEGKAVRPALTLACAAAAAAGPGLFSTAAAGPRLFSTAAAGPRLSSTAAAGPRQSSTVDDAAARTTSTAAVDAAVAVELVHDFSLLHDDVMDGDLTRRHRPAAWAVFGVPRATLAGDALLATAVQRLAQTGQDPASACALVRVLATAVQELCAGQALDLAFEARADVTVAECRAMAEGKTAALIGAACELGALAAGADAGRARCYRMFGRRLGLAFQLADDLLGIWGDPAVTGKPAGSDLVSRKKSLPVVAALNSGTRAGEQLALLYGQEHELDERDAALAAALVEQSGGRAWARAEADRQAAAALRALAEADPDPAAVTDLEALTALLARRDH
jgi:geranylgeranyl diphosphate synthase type I